MDILNKNNIGYIKLILHPLDGMDINTLDEIDTEYGYTGYKQVHKIVKYIYKGLLIQSVKKHR